MASISSMMAAAQRNAACHWAQRRWHEQFWKCRNGSSRRQVSGSQLHQLVSYIERAHLMSRGTRTKMCGKSPGYFSGHTAGSNVPCVTSFRAHSSVLFAAKHHHITAAMLAVRADE